MKHTRISICALSFLSLSAVLMGCIRDTIPPCPPLSLSLEVTDKNYSNIHAASRLGLEEERDENLPFRDYVSNLCYRLSDANTGKIISQLTLTKVDETDDILRISFPDDLPFGTYVFTVWGNIDEPQSLDDNFSTLQLLTDNLQGDDVYMASDTLLYDEAHYSYTLGMKRVKGKLIIETQDMPDDFRYSIVSASDLYGHVDSEWKYVGLSSIRLSHIWEQPVHDIYKLTLPPSVRDGATEFIQRVYEGANDEREWLESEPVQISLRRNELTVLRFVYDLCCCRFKIYMLVNDNWETLHSMEIQ